MFSNILDAFLFEIIKTIFVWIYSSRALLLFPNSISIIIMINSS